MIIGINDNILWFSKRHGNSVFIHTSILPTLLTIQNSGNRAIIHRRTMNYSYPIVITNSYYLI